MLRLVIVKAMRRLSTIFSHESGLKFSSAVGIFPKMNVSPKKVFTFYSRLSDTALLKVSPGCMPIVPPKPPLIKWREAYWCNFSILAFPLPPENFLPTPMIVTC